MSQTDKFPESKIEEYAAIYRELVKQENTRWDERTKWLLQIQTILFTGVAFAWKVDNLLVLTLAFIGLMSSISIGLLIHYASRTINNLKREWDENKGDYLGPSISGPARIEMIVKNRTLQKVSFMHIFGSAFMLPLFFIIGWICIIIIKVFIR